MAALGLFYAHFSTEFIFGWFEFSNVYLEKREVCEYMDVDKKKSSSGRDNDATSNNLAKNSHIQRSKRSAH